VAEPTLFKLQRLETRVGPVALVTIDNGADWQKPNTFGEGALRSLDETLDRLRSRDWRGLVLTGKPYVFAAGADIDEFVGITPDEAREGARIGHELFGRLRNLPFLSLAAINGAALGGGVEIALHCDYRTISASVRHFACPEVFLGIVPGWGGSQLVPRLVGAEQAVRFIVENPLRQNRMLNAAQALEAGFVDAVFEPAEFLDESLEYLLRLTEEGPGKRIPAADLRDVAEVCRKARSRLDGQVHGASPAPYRALDLIEGSAAWSLEEGYHAEQDATAELLPGPHAQASLYAFSLVERRAKRGVGRPDAEPRTVRKVGIAGAGLMARQLALLVLRRLEVPVVLCDLTQELVDDAVAWIDDELGELTSRGRLHDR
jgi:enoyl-CoA hydratase/carnithine racemase